MEISDETVQDYAENGFVRISDVFPCERVDNVRKMIWCLYRKHVPSDDSLDTLTEPWNDARFDQKLIDLRAEKAKIFSVIYDSAQSSIDNHLLLTDPASLRLAEQFLGEDPHNLSVSGVMLRMDAPYDTRNVIKWHQDGSYYLQNRDGNHGLVFIVALQDTPSEMGSPLICPKSHKEGLVESIVTEKKDYSTTQQKTVPAEAVERYEPVSAPLNKGDVLLMNMNVFHSSGKNVSDKIRFSLLFRFHKMMAADFVPFRSPIVFNEYMLKNV